MNSVGRTRSHRRRLMENFNNGLERKQSGALEDDRRRSEGREGDLSEVAAPWPIGDRRRRRDSFEREEDRASQRRKSHASSATDRDNEWTEVAAPRPVETDADEEVTDEEQGTTPQQSDNKEGLDSSEPQYSSLATEIYTLSWLILFSFLGTLARLGVETITVYPNAPWSSPVLWANVGGSFALGFLSEDRNLFRHEWSSTESTKNSFHPSKLEKDTASVHAKASLNHSKIKKTIPIYIGLATGFCGSFTSFSSFILDVFLALSNDLPLASSNPYHKSTTIPSRNGGYSFMALLAIIIIQITASLAALNTGAHFALLTAHIIPTLPFKLTRKILDPLAVCLALGCWLGAILLSIFPPQLKWQPRTTFALVFAPIGCLTRFYASKCLNARIPSFPLGTFIVNVFGTCILGMCYDLQHARSIGAAPGGGYIACGVLEGVNQGFCGCLTTVSTWVVELNSLRRRHAYLYGTASVGTALLSLIVIMGSVGWTIGFETSVCLST